MTAALTKRQSQALDAIKRLTEANGYAPSLDDLATEMGLSGRSNAHWLVTKLKDLGLVDWDAGVRRSLRVLEDDPYARRRMSRLTDDQLLAVRLNAESIMAARA